jgi:hypothetical protein
LRYEVLTGLRHEQLQELTVRILERAGDVARRGGRPAAIGLAGSVAMVVTLLRKNITQEVAGAIFGVSQATVSRRWDLLRPLIGQVLAGLVPGPAEIAGKGGTLLVDGTVCPVWDWSAVPGLFSGKAGYPGMNVQIAATMAGNLAAVERAVAHLKTWRMLSEEGGRFRPPLAKFDSVLKAIIGLFFLSNYYEAFE